MGKILQFKSCAVGGEYNGLGAVTPSSYGYISVQTPANIVNHINKLREKSHMIISLDAENDFDKSSTPSC